MSSISAVPPVASGGKSGYPPAILTIAGSDSSGGAGIQADLKTFSAFQCYGTSVVTALTAQNTLGVQAVHAPPPEFIKAQIASVLSDVEIHAIKTGMLFDADNVRAVVHGLKSYFSEGNFVPLVCDPVCVSTSGHTLLQAEAIDVLVKDFIPLTTVITPNKSEAELLLSHLQLPSNISSLQEMLAAGQNLLKLGCQAVLLKGGHVTVSMEEVSRATAADAGINVVRHGLLGQNMQILQVLEPDFSAQPLVIDILCEMNENSTLFVRPRVESTSTHGTGCTLSAALACALGSGSTLKEATQLATAYVHQGIEDAYPVGRGYGPLNHLHSVTRLVIPRPTLTNPHPFVRLLIQHSADIWNQYVEHDFVKLLGKGTLPRENFVHFIKQDYHYLRYYARAHGLLGAKSSAFTDIQAAAGKMLHIVREASTVHKAFCAEWGVGEEELDSTPESPATTAYGAYLLDMGLQGDSMQLIMAVAACLLGYGEVGLWLKKEALLPDTWVKLEGNPYLRWIEDYSGEDFQTAVRVGIETIEIGACLDPPSPARLASWVAVWKKCTWLEKGFWDMAMQLS